MLDSGTGKFLVSSDKSMEANQQNKSRLIADIQRKSKIDPAITDQNKIKGQQQKDQTSDAKSMVKSKISDAKLREAYLNQMKMKLNTKDDSVSLALTAKDKPKSNVSNVSQNVARPKSNTSNVSQLVARPELKPKGNKNIKFNSGTSFILMADKQQPIEPILKPNQPENNLIQKNTQLKYYSGVSIIHGGQQKPESKILPAQQNQLKLDDGQEESDQKAVAVNQGQIGSNILEGQQNKSFHGSTIKSKFKDADASSTIQ